MAVQLKVNQPTVVIVPLIDLRTQTMLLHANRM